MSRALLFAALLLACSAGIARASLPDRGTLDGVRALGGVRLGDTAARVRAVLGRSYGVCQGCATTTWYFTYRAFEQQGLGVELTRGRVSGVYTLWQPAGWRGAGGLALGAVQAQVTKLLGPLLPVTCTGYDALVRDAGSARAVYYIVDGKLWGFGLLRAHASPCR